ncbi:MAG: hypothetical protein WCI27_07670 [Candidatus Omnitrophota bacterium]
MREIIIPILEKEVNEGKNFARLRQVYNSLILAIWYKNKVMGAVQETPLGFYVDQNKVKGIHIKDPREAAKIWSQYVESFKKGVYDYIREEHDPVTRETVPRKYFAGGVDFAGTITGEVSFSLPEALVPNQVVSRICQVELIPLAKNATGAKGSPFLFDKKIPGGDFLDNPGGHLLLALEQASFSLERKVGALSPESPQAATLRLAIDFLDIIRQEIPLGSVSPDLRQLAAKIIEPAKVSLTTAKERVDWLQEVLNLRTTYLASQAKTSNGRITDKLTQQLMRALGGLQDGGDAEQKIEMWAREYHDLMFTCRIQTNDSDKKTKAMIKSFEVSFIRYLEYVQRKYAENKLSGQEQRLLDPDILLKTTEILSIQGDKDVFKEFKRDRALLEEWPVILEALEQLLLTHFESMTDDSRSVLLAMLLNGYSFGRHAGLKQSGQSGAMVAARLFLESKDVTFFQKDQMLQIIVFVGLKSLSREVAEKIVSEVAYYGQEGTVKGKKILRQYEQLVSQKDGFGLRQYAATVWKKLSGIEAMGPEAFGRLKDEVLRTPMLTQNGIIQGYAAEEYGVGFEFEMSTDYPFAEAKNGLEKHLKAVNLDNQWKASAAGGDQMEITTPFYPNLGNNWRKLKAELSKALQNNSFFNHITSMHINTNFNPLNRYLQHLAFSQLLKVLEGVLWRTTRHKAVFESNDFPSPDIRIPTEALFATDWLYKRGMMNLRVNKIEGRYHLPPTYHQARDVNMDLLRQYVHMQYALVKYAAEHVTEINLLRLPLPVTLGEQRSPEYDWKLMCFMDRVFGKDVLAKAIFIKLYFHPRWGVWRTLSSEDADILQDEVRWAYEKRGFGNIYRMHQESGGYESDPINFIRQKISKAETVDQVNGLVWGLINEIRKLQGDRADSKDMKEILEILRARGWGWVEALWPMRDDDGLSVWLAVTPIGQMVQGKGLNVQRHDFYDELVKHRVLWMNLSQYWNSSWVTHHARRLFLNALVSSDATAKDIMSFLGMIDNWDERKELVDSLVTAVKGNKSPEQQQKIFLCLLDYFEGIPDNLSKQGKVLQRLQEQDLFIKLLCYRQLRIIAFSKQYTGQASTAQMIRRTAQKILIEIGAMDKEKDIISLLHNDDRMIVDFVINMFAGRSGVATNILLLMIESDTGINRLNQFMDQYMSQGGDLRKLEALADSLSGEDDGRQLLNIQKKIIIYQRIKAQAKLFALYTSTINNWDVGDRIFYGNQIWKALRGTAQEEAMRDLLTKAMATESAWHFAGGPEMSVSVDVDLKYMGQETVRVVSYFKKILSIDHNGGVDVFDLKWRHMFSAQISFLPESYRETAHGVVGYSQANIVIFDKNMRPVNVTTSPVGRIFDICETAEGILVGGQNGLVLFDSALQLRIMLSTTVGAIFRMIRVSKGIFIDSEHGIFLLNDRHELISMEHLGRKHFKWLKETSRGLFMGGAEGCVLLNDKLEVVRKLGDVSSIHETSQGIIFSHDFGTWIWKENEEKHWQLGAYSNVERIDEVAGGFLLSSLDRRVMLDKDFKERWSMQVGTGYRSLIIKRPGIDAEEIDMNNVFNPVDDIIRPWGFIIKSSASVLFLDYDLHLIAEVPTNWTLVTSVTYQGETFVVSGKIHFSDSAESLLQDNNKSKTGGIDLRPEQLRLETKSDRPSITFTMDPAVMKKYQFAPGLEPVIIDSQPVQDWAGFLGMSAVVDKRETG